MKKSLIAISIKKQLYFGIFGVILLFGILCLLLIILASTKLFFSFNKNIKSLFNKIDTNIVSLNGENADIFGQLLYTQGRFETLLLRNYFDLLSDNFGEDMLNNINIDQDEINKNFKFYGDTTDLCEEEGSKCFFVFSESKINNDLKKRLFFLKPIIDMTLVINSYNKESIKVFNNFDFFDKESNSYISYKYNKLSIQQKFNSTYPPNQLMENTINFFLGIKNLIETLNSIKINDSSYDDIFRKNVYSILPSFDGNVKIDPFFNGDIKVIHFCSFLFNQNDNDIIDLDKIKLENLKNHMSLVLKVNYLSLYSFNYVLKNGGVYVLVVEPNLNYSISKSLCKLINYTNYTYSDNSIINNLNFSFDLLNAEENQEYPIDICFQNKLIQDIIKSDRTYNYELKILTNFYKYSYDKDINNNIKVKILRSFSPKNFTKSLLKIKLYSSFIINYLILKIYNNISIIEILIDRITYKSIIYITLFTFLLWIIIFVFALIKLYLVADSISSPIRKLIKSLSLNQEDFNNNNLIFEKIYYKEDKDINDLFQLCQKLIIGGFKRKNIIKKSNKLNVYNNVSIVKTNNMIINENDIIVQRNQKYNEIFERRNIMDKREDKFKSEIYNHYMNEDLEAKIRIYEGIKSKRISLENKEELESLKDKDTEYKMFFYINKEIEGLLPFNSLYKCYYDEFSKKANKKKKK